MKGARAGTVVFLCFAACLVGLVVAHIQLRQEMGKLRRAVRAAILMNRDSPDVPAEIERDLERLDSELDEVRYHVKKLYSKVDSRGYRLEELDDEVSGLRVLVYDAQSMAREVAESSDIVRRYELDQEIQSLEKRIKAIEIQSAIRRRY